MTILEHIHPPGVLGANANVIRHEVRNMPHTMRPQSGHEGLKVFARADLRIECVVIDHVIAMHAARPRAEVRRAVDVADAEIREVGDQRSSVTKSELRIELNAVSGARNLHYFAVARERSTARRSRGRSSSQVTLHGASSLRET